MVPVSDFSPDSLGVCLETLSGSSKDSGEKSDRGRGARVLLIPGDPYLSQTSTPDLCHSAQAATVAAGEKLVMTRGLAERACRECQQRATPRHRRKLNVRKKLQNVQLCLPHLG